jgi:hypothetical protein
VSDWRTPNVTNPTPVGEGFRTDLSRLRLATALKRCGAKRHIGPSGNQESVQNLAERPSPTTMETDAWNMAWAARSGLRGRAHQLSSGRVRRSHSQRMRNAYPAIFKSENLRPPKRRGACPVRQATLHHPPATLSVPAQRNARRRLSIWRTAQLESPEAMDTCTGMADKVTFVRVARPA